MTISARKAMALMISQEIHSSRDNSKTPDARLSSDRLSHLPESIIFHIFSFLDPNDTFFLSLVSRKFQQLCLHSPYLSFLTDFDDSDDDLKKKYAQFCRYVHKVMKSRECLGIETDRFLIRCFSKYLVNERCALIGTMVKFAINSNVKELDIGVDFARLYFLPECVFGCQSLRRLILNLRMGEFVLAGKKISIQDLVLDSVTISESYFGQKISRNWASLTRLNLVRVRWIGDLSITSSSLEELKLSDSRFGIGTDKWLLSLQGCSLKSASISRCRFTTQCHITLCCQSLENFTVLRSRFEEASVFDMGTLPLQCLRVFGKVSAPALLECFEISGSYFEKTCSFCISCLPVQHVKFSSCKFKGFCHLKIDTSSLGNLTISDCKMILPEEKISNSDHKRRTIIDADKLQRLTLISFDKFAYEFPLSINAPHIQNIMWQGNPVDFSYLGSFMSLENAAIDIEPSCKHKSRILACRCKHFKSSIYCVAMLLQSLKRARLLKINIWPIEMFFMQNEQPIYFDNLVHLILSANDSLAEQVPFIASFLKGLPNLRTLVIQCEEKSHVLGDLNFMNSLGLCPKSFNLLLSEDWKKVKIQRITAEAAEE